jgi:hypothetical protein
MKKVLFVLLALAGLSVLSVVRATVIAQNFTNNPSQDGWRIFGNTNLFQWDSTNHDLAVTWDSSQPNSYFYHPLGTILTIEDDFSLSFDLQVFDAVGYNYSCQIAVDLFRFTDATNTNYSHADGTLPNVFEFGYFPATDELSPSIDATLIDTNGDYYFAFDNQALNPGVTYSVTITHTAGAPTVTGQVLTGGEPFSSLSIIYSQPISDFRLDTLSISCFQDDGDGDSILAHGAVGNIVVTLPPPPIQNLSGCFSHSNWQAQFISRSNWIYTLERTTNFVSWTDASIATNGSGTNLSLKDTNAPADKAFYRVRAERP